MKEKPTAKKSSVTQNEYLMLVGLLTLAKSHHDKLLELEKAIVEHLGGHWRDFTDDVMNRVSDAIYEGGEVDPDRLLEQLDIAVDDG